MFDNYSFPSVTLAVIISGTIWLLLNKFSKFSNSKIDNLSIFGGIFAGISFSLFARGLEKNYFLDIIAIFILITSFFRLKFKLPKFYKTKGKNKSF